jgi:hypothetical protein
MSASIRSRLKRAGFAGVLTLGITGSFAVLPQSSAFADTNASHSALLNASATCGSFAAEDAYITFNGANWGLVQLSYSSCTRNAWGYGVSYNTCYPNSDPGGEAPYGCAVVYGVENGVGDMGECVTGRGGQPLQSCNTNQWSDANVTSYAWAYIGSQSGSTAVGTTASY